MFDCEVCMVGRGRGMLTSLAFSPESSSRCHCRALSQSGHPLPPRSLASRAASCPARFSR